MSRDRIKCYECGKFIGVQDLIDGKALHHCVLPDSEFSDETFESLCAKCLKEWAEERAAGVQYVTPYSIVRCPKRWWE